MTSEYYEIEKSLLEFKESYRRLQRCHVSTIVFGIGVVCLCCFSAMRCYAVGWSFAGWLMSVLAGFEFVIVGRTVKSAVKYHREYRRILTLAEAEMSMLSEKDLD